MLENTIDYRNVFGNREEQLLHFMMDDFTYGIIRNRYSRQQSDYLMKRYIDDRFYTLHIFENSGLMLRKEKEFVGLVDMKEMFYIATIMGCITIRGFKRSLH